jgi:hypothetical protein
MGSKSLYLKVLFPLFILSGCMGIPTPHERLQTLQGILSHYSLIESTIKTSTFNLFYIHDNRISECTDKNLNVYIEGDGLAWRTSSVVSNDPTPINPLALKLMTLDPDPCKVYIARPCQYVGSSTCKQEYWTSKRFSNTVISSYQEALNYLKKNIHNKSFTLIGYSGGGAIAVLTAVKREDIQKIVTIAGNLDTDIWVQKHNLAALSESLNPADYAQQVENIEQWHFIGKDDPIVPKWVFDSYFSRCDKKQNIHFLEVDATHSKNWEMIYSDLLNSHFF